MRRALGLLLAVALAAPVFAVDLSNDITVDNVLRLMNDYRAEHGLPPLQLDARLTLAAEDRMRDMADGGWWSHSSPSGESPFSWLAAREYPYAFAAENLACGFETARLLVSSWMESRGHRQNILGAEFADSGIAVLDGSTKGPASGKSIVVLFGRRR